MQKNQLALAAAVSSILNACSSDSISIDEEALDPMPPTKDGEGWSNVATSTTDTTGKGRTRTGYLSADSRRAIDAMANEMLERLEPARTIDSMHADDARGDEAEAEAATDNEAPTAEPMNESDVTTLEARAAWNRFLDSVRENPEGSFAIGDMYVRDETQLLQMFEALYTSKAEKGLILPGKAWPSPRALSVCWTPDSNATPAERQRVAQLVNARWAATSNVTFDFGTAPNMRTCAEAPCGFLLCPTGGEQIRIYQNSAITRGCASVGNEHTSTTSLDCGFGTFHDYASMYLPTGASTGNNVFVDYTSVHEFGHAMGLLHEQGRSEYNYLVPGARNCTSADTEQTVTGSNPPVRSPATAGQVNNGLFDDFSIMNYCQQEENLNGGSNYADARASFLSAGDISSVRAMYTAPVHAVRVKHSSWLVIGMQITVQGTTFSVVSHSVAGTLDTGLSMATGDAYAITVTPVQGGRIRCFAYGRAQNVFNNPPIVPPGGFTSNPAVAECYDPAGLSLVITTGSFL